MALPTTPTKQLQPPKHTEIRMLKYILALLSFSQAQHYLSLDQWSGLGYKYKYKDFASNISFYGNLNTHKDPDISKNTIYNFGLSPSLDFSYDLFSKEKLTISIGSGALYSKNFTYSPSSLAHFEKNYNISLHSLIGFNININEKLSITAKEILQFRQVWIYNKNNSPTDIFLEYTPQFGLNYQI